MSIDFDNVKSFQDYIKLLTEALQKEEAMKRDEAETLISALSPQVCEHLMKCLMFGKNCQDYEHWAREIHGWLNSIQMIKLKQLSGKPSLKDLCNWACDEWLDENAYNNELINVMYDNEVYNPIGYTELKNNYKEFITFYKKILKEVSQKTYNAMVLKKHLDIWLKKHDITESKEN